MTTRELARLIKLFGIDIENIEPEDSDEPFKISSSSAKLPATIGGTSEAVIRTLKNHLSGNDMPNPKISKLRGTKDKKQTKVKIGDKQYNFLAVSPLANIEQMIEDIQKDKNRYHYIEVMACPGGCVNGGGQPLNNNERNIRNRIKTIQNLDDKSAQKFAHKNTFASDFFTEKFEKPFSEAALKHLHTKYAKRDVLL
jgi:NADH-quinone oxidoreductase subunit G/NADP-reducing hydrogenase subunit HndD